MLDGADSNDLIGGEYSPIRGTSPVRSGGELVARHQELRTELDGVESMLQQLQRQWDKAQLDPSEEAATERSRLQKLRADIMEYGFRANEELRSIDRDATRYMSETAQQGQGVLNFNEGQTDLFGGPYSMADVEAISEPSVLSPSGIEQSLGLRFPQPGAAKSRMSDVEAALSEPTNMYAVLQPDQLEMRLDAGQVSALQAGQLDDDANKQAEAKYAAKRTAATDTLIDKEPDGTLPIKLKPREIETHDTLTALKDAGTVTPEAYADMVGRVREALKAGDSKTLSAVNKEARKLATPAPVAPATPAVTPAPVAPTAPTEPVNQLLQGQPDVSNAALVGRGSEQRGAGGGAVAGTSVAPAGRAADAAVGNNPATDGVAAVGGQAGAVSNAQPGVAPTVDEGAPDIVTGVGNPNATVTTKKTRKAALGTDERRADILARIQAAKAAPSPLSGIKGKQGGGIDVGLLSLYAELAADHIVKTGKNFAEFTRRMVADLGEEVEPYLRRLHTDAQAEIRKAAKPVAVERTPDGAPVMLESKDANGKVVGFTVKLKGKVGAYLRVDAPSGQLVLVPERSGLTKQDSPVYLGETLDEALDELPFAYGLLKSGRKIEEASGKIAVEFEPKNKAVVGGAIDFNLLQQATEGKPQYLKSIYLYLGIDKDGTRLMSKPMSANAAAREGGWGKNSGQNLTKAMNSLGITDAVMNRFMQSDQMALPLPGEAMPLSIRERLEQGAEQDEEGRDQYVDDTADSRDEDTRQIEEGARGAGAFEDDANIGTEDSSDGSVLERFNEGISTISSVGGSTMGTEKTLTTRVSASKQFKALAEAIKQTLPLDSFPTEELLSGFNKVSKHITPDMLDGSESQTVIDNAYANDEFMLGVLAAIKGREKRAQGSASARKQLRDAYAAHTRTLEKDGSLIRDDKKGRSKTTAERDEEFVAGLERDEKGNLNEASDTESTGSTEAAALFDSATSEDEEAGRADEEQLGNADTANARRNNEDRSRGQRKDADEVNSQNRAANMDPLPDEAAAVEAGLTGKDPIAAADWLAANAPDSDQRLIAAMVAKKLRDMARMGVKFKLTIAQVGDKVPSSLMGARGLNVYTFGQPGANPAEMHVWLNGSTVTGKVGVSYETALHELVHSATVAAIRLANMKVNAGTSIATSVSNLFYVNNAIIREFNKRVAASKAGTYTLSAFEQAILEGNNNAFRNPDETITWALTNREAQKWLESVPYKQSGNLWGALVGAVRSFLGLQAKADTALSEVLQLGQELLEANVNSLAQMAGAVGTNFSINAPAGQIILQNVSSAAPANTQTQPVATAEKAIRAYPPALRPAARAVHRALGKYARGALNTVMFTEDLMNRAIDLGMKSAKAYKDLANQKESFTGSYERRVLNTVSGYTDLPEKLKGKGPGTVNAFLQDSQMQSEFAGKWGYQPSWLDKVEIDPKAKAAYEALGDKGMAYADAVFKLGHDTLALKKQTVIESTTSEYDVLIAAAKKDGSTKEVAELTDEKTKTLEQFGTMMKLGGKFPYSPVKRFGNYVVVAESQKYIDARKAGDTKLMRQLEGDPNEYFVDFAESDGDARKIEDELRATGLYVDPGYRPRETMRDDLYGGSNTLKALSKLRERAAAMPEATSQDKQTKEAAIKLRTLLTDLYLMQLAEGSSRKSEMKRRGVAGNIDMIRSLETQGKADAHFLGSVKFGGKMLESIGEMRKEMRDGTSDQRLRRSEVLNEVIARHMQSMDYKETPLVDALRMVPSVFFLAMSPSYYIQNALQPFMLSLPLMAAKHGYGKTSKALVDAYTSVAPAFKNADVLKQIDFDALLASGNNALTKDEKVMVQSLLDSGRLDIGMATEFGSLRADGDGKVSAAWNKARDGLTGLQSKVEALNRLSTALAAFRLESGSGAVKAAAYADRIIQESHGDYNAQNAPRAFNTAWGKIGLQFKKYQLIQLTLMAKLLSNSFGEAKTKEEKDARTLARKALFYTMGQAAVIGGGKALPIPFVVAWLFGAAFGDDSDEPPEYVLRQMIGNKDIADLLISGPLSFAGINGSGLGGFGNAVAALPFVDVDLTSREGVIETAFAIGAGPLGGLALKTADGVGAMTNGDYFKGLGMLLPKGPGSFIKAGEQSINGIYQRDGDSTMSADEISGWATFQQAMGFTPQQTLERQYRQQAAYKIDGSMKDQNSEIKRMYSRALKDGESTTEAKEAWLKYQAKRVNMGYERQPMSELTKSAQTQRKREKETVGGVQYKKNNEQFVRELNAY